MGHSCGTLFQDSCTRHLSGHALVCNFCGVLLRSSVQSDCFVRDFLQNLQVKSPKQALRTRLPPKLNCQVCKTSVLYESRFSKTHSSSLQNELLPPKLTRPVCVTSVSYEASSKSHALNSRKRAFRTRLPSIVRREVSTETTALPSSFAIPAPQGHNRRRTNPNVTLTFTKHRSLTIPAPATKT